MPYTLHLLVFPTRASKVNGVRAHWALFIPSSSSSSGKLIQVLGTPFTGYGLEFKRNYSLSTLSEKYKSHILGEIEDEYIDFGDAGDGRSSTDVTPRDKVEKLAKRIEPPGTSAKPLDPMVGKRCQDWTRELVEVLIQKGILNVEARSVLDQAKAIEGARGSGA